MIGRFLDRSAVRWVICVGLPIAMILLDPAVFHSRVFGVGMPLLGWAKPFCYLATLIAVGSAAAWLTVRRPSAAAAGIFVGGALFAIALGCAILPFSALGILFLGLGLLGFTPFLMAAAYFRIGKAAYPQELPRRRRLVGFALGLITILGIPMAAQVTGSRALQQSVQDIASADTALASGGVERLRRWSLLVDLERLVAAYMSEADPQRQARIASAYHELTGQDAAQRAAELMD